MSFSSSITRDYAWSELSKLTLAHLSIISVIALPIKASELTDSSWYQANITTAVRALQLQALTRVSAQKVKGKTPERSRKLAIVEEVEGLKVKQLEEEVMRTMEMIEDRLLWESNKVKKQSLEAIDGMIRESLAEFKLVTCEDPDSVHFSDLDQLVSKLHDIGTLSPSDLLQRIRSTMKVLDELIRGDPKFPSIEALLALYDQPHSGSVPRKWRLLPKKRPLGNLKSQGNTSASASTSGSQPQDQEVTHSFHSTDTQEEANDAERAQTNVPSDTVPLDDQTFSCEGYVTLDLSERGLQELSLDSLRTMANKVQILILDENKISDFDIAMDSLEHLQVLRIRRNGLVRFPYELIPLELHSIDISHNFIDQIPSSVSEMHQLREFAAYGNGFGELPAAIWKMERLEKLYVQWTVWRAWCEANNESVVDWKVVERHDVGLYTLGWVELERDRPPPFMS